MVVYKKIVITIQIFAIILIVISAVSCSNEAITKEGLINYINNPENGLIKEYEQDRIKITVRLKPSDLFVLQELEAAPDYDEKAITELKRKYSNYYYFNVELSVNNQDVTKNVSNEQNDRMLQSIVFNMQNNVGLITSNKDTINPIDYITPRMYGMTEKTTFLFAFENQKIIETNPETIVLVFKNNLKDAKEIKFEFDNNSIQKAPKLIIQKIKKQ